MDLSNQLLRVAVFYDGNYFLRVSNYYNYYHPSVKARLGIKALHQFITKKIKTATQNTIVKIVDSHYFRCRMNAKDTAEKGDLLYFDRLFDEILSGQGVTTHYFPFRSGDIELHSSMILESYDTAVQDKADVIVLITSSSTYVPLVNRLNALGKKVMLMHWEFEYEDDYDGQVCTKTSHELIQSVNLPVSMSTYIDNLIKKGKLPELFV